MKRLLFVSWLSWHVDRYPFPDFNAHQVFADFQGPEYVFRVRGTKSVESAGTMCEYTASFGFTRAKTVPACSAVVCCPTIICKRSGLKEGLFLRSASGSTTS